MLTGNGLQRLLAAAAGPAAANKNRRQSQSVATLLPPRVAAPAHLPPPAAPGLGAQASGAGTGPKHPLEKERQAAAPLEGAQLDNRSDWALPSASDTVPV